MESGLFGNRGNDFAIAVAGGANSLSITLVWYDRTDGGATGALVYDLDLILRRTDDGNIYRGGVLSFNDGESRRLQTNVDKRNAAFRGSTNTVEKIYIANPAAGAYSIRVKRRRLHKHGPLSASRASAFCAGSQARLRSRFGKPLP